MILKSAPKFKNNNDAISKGSAGRHETFTPRYGWLKKGYDRCIENYHVFNDDNSIEQLGVGKNMVRSIRFWCMLFGLLEESDTPGCMKPTLFGKKLLDTENGWDPYIEDPSSLWLLHWNVFLPPYTAVSWPLFFNSSINEFRKKELESLIISKAKKIDGLSRISDNSFDKDASCIIRTYCNDNDEKNDIVSPFSVLGLITRFSYEGSCKYKVNTASKNSLPDLVFMASVFSYAFQWFSEQQTLSLQEITYGLNSPGIAFKLSEAECGNIIERAHYRIKGVSFVDNNGLKQLQFNRPCDLLTEECLELYYGKQA